jgi:hypothetical protein
LPKLEEKYSKICVKGNTKHVYKLTVNVSTNINKNISKNINATEAGGEYNANEDRGEKSQCQKMIFHKDVIPVFLSLLSNSLND